MLGDAACGLCDRGCVAGRTTTTMPTKAEITQVIVQEHFRIEDGLELIAIVRAQEDEPIRLIEINACTVSTGGVEVFSFSPTPEVPFMTEVAEITPEEFEQLKSGVIDTPVGWSFDDIVDMIERPAA